MSKRTLAVGAMSAALLMLGAGVASAHECYIVNRSDQGNTAATNSDRWVTVTVEGFVNSDEFPPGVNAQCFLDYWLGHGGPEAFTVRSDKTIGEGSANPNLADGNGLNHIEDAYGALFGAAVGACLE